MVPPRTLIRDASLHSIHLEDQPRMLDIPAATKYTTRALSVQREASRESSLSDRADGIPNTSAIFRQSDSKQSSLSAVALPTSRSTTSRASRRTKKIRILLFAQIVALLTAVILGLQSSLYFHCTLSAPAFTSMFAYLLQCFHFIPLLKKQRSIDNKSKNNINGSVISSSFSWIQQDSIFDISLAVPIQIHFLVAFLSVEAFYFAMLACRYTTVTSVALFDSLGIPVIMLLSRCIFRRQYKHLHLLGAFICFVGVVINALSDYHSDRAAAADADTITFRSIQQLGVRSFSSVQRKAIAIEEDKILNDGSGNYPHKLFGDLLAIMAGVLGGIWDACTEMVCRKSGGTHEYLAMVGFFGFFISLTQAVILERDAIMAFFQGYQCSVGVSIGLFTGYILAFFLRNEAIAYFLFYSEAALLNLSLLVTVNLYGAIFLIGTESILPRAQFWVAFLFVVVGVVVYELEAPPVLENSSDALAEKKRQEDQVKAANRIPLEIHL